MELTNFKRFTHLIVENIPETAKLVLLVGQNGSGKTSFMEAMNHFYKYSGYGNFGDYTYLSKNSCVQKSDSNSWYNERRDCVKISFHDCQLAGESIRGHFYFRSAYRNEPSFHIDTMQKQANPLDSFRLNSMIQNDKTVSSNYQRLVANTIAGVYSDSNSNKSVESLREELIGKIKEAITNIFDDLQLSSLGKPLENGDFYFTKGDAKDFSYQNLSAGEKSAFDLILDFVVQSEYYPDAIYCIDEPETHMHTKLQSKVLRQLYNLIPGDSQLWISTHSVGMLQEAETIENDSPGSVAFLDFGDKDFDIEQMIYPSKIGKAIMEKFYELAFGEFAKLMLPKKIVFCEGDSNGGKRRDFDKSIYSKIFENTHRDVFFISGGSCTDIENIEKKYGEIITVLLKNSEVIKIVDRDDRSETEIEELANKGIRVLKNRNLESYLLDDTLIRKLCETKGQAGKFDECIEKKKEAIQNSIMRGKPQDDLKSARGEIYNSLKELLGLTACGNNADSFLRDTMAPLITEDTAIYQQLEEEIFGQTR